MEIVAEFKDNIWRQLPELFEEPGIHEQLVKSDKWSWIRKKPRYGNGILTIDDQTMLFGGYVYYDP